MFASNRQTWKLRALIAASLALVWWSESWAAAPTLNFPATAAYHRRNYDPFDDATAKIKDGWTAAKSQPAPAKPIAKSQIVPLPPVKKLQPAAPPVKRAAFQPTASTPPEPLPTPPGGYQYEDSEEKAGSTWVATPICELQTDIVLPEGLLPKDHWIDRSQQFAGCDDDCQSRRCWPVKEYNWVASCLCHNPLYFEEINLERYGYGCGCYGTCCSNMLQSSVSACHFFATVVALPYEMAVDCPGECDYALGYYRPGSCPPWRYNCCTKPSYLGALAEGGVATGIIFLIP